MRKLITSVALVLATLVGSGVAATPAQAATCRTIAPTKLNNGYWRYAVAPSPATNAHVFTFRIKTQDWKGWRRVHYFSQQPKVIVVKVAGTPYTVDTQQSGRWCRAWVK